MAKKQRMLNDSEISNLKKTFGRSLALSSKLPSGSVISKKNLTLKKPGTGIPYKDINKVVGRSLKIDKDCNLLLSLGDFKW